MDKIEIYIVKNNDETIDHENKCKCVMFELERFDGSDPHYKCSLCSHENYEDEEPNYCPGCGSSVLKKVDLGGV